MTRAKHPRRLFLALYGSALKLYPAEFREHCAGEIQRCAARMQDENPGAETTFRLMEDLVRSLLTEHLP